MLEDQEIKNNLPRNSNLSRNSNLYACPNKAKVKKLQRQECRTMH
jgi:hypothetical protein